MPARKGKSNSKKDKVYLVPSLSGVHLQDVDVPKTTKQSVSDAINDAELQKALDKWIKEHHYDNKIVARDLTLLRSIITEYMDSYILLGYNLEGQRVVIQNFNSPKDKDALMEFFKNLFIQQQQSNFFDNN
jgi:hypothetical protein